jgi:hypothetical protein
MNMPGFTAESSIYGKSRYQQTHMDVDLGGRAVHLAQYDWYDCGSWCQENCSAVMDLGPEIFARCLRSCLNRCYSTPYGSPWRANSLRHFFEAPW